MAFTGYDSENVRYSERDSQCVMDVKSVGIGTGKTAIIRFEGGGMARSDKKLIDKHTPLNAYGFFTNPVGDGWADNNAAFAAIDNLVVFSCNYVLHRAQYTGTHDDLEDLSPDHPNGEFTLRYTSNPGYMDQWVLCALDAVAHVKRNAVLYGIDPDKIILSGSSAGGLMAAAAGYMTSPGFSTRADAFNTKPNVRRFSSDVAGLVLHDSPLDLSIQATAGIYEPFLRGHPGDTTASAWDANLIDRARRVSAFQIMEDNLRIPHVFSWYEGEYDAADDVSDGSIGTAHSPSWGVTHHNRIEVRWGGDGTGKDGIADQRPNHQLVVQTELVPASLEAATGVGNTFASLHPGGTWPMTQIRQWFYENDFGNNPTP